MIEVVIECGKCGTTSHVPPGTFKSCPTCGAQATEGPAQEVFYCKHCGARSEIAPDTMTCPSCNRSSLDGFEAPIVEFAIDCRGCGQRWLAPHGTFLVCPICGQEASAEEVSRE